jgi:hypothetical protein
MLTCLRRQPLALLVALAVVPSAWNIPMDLVYDHVVPQEARDAGTAPRLLDAAMLFASVVWGCILYGGQLLIAIDSARGRRVRWRRFREGLSFTWRLTLTTLVFVLPASVVIYLPEGDLLEVLAAPLAAAVATIILMARTILWGPLIVDARGPLWGTLRASWLVTRGQIWKVVLLGIAFLVPVVPIFVAEALVYDEFWVASGLCGALYTLAVAQLYVLAPELSGSGIAEYQLATRGGHQVDSESDLPTTGSGWSRPFE